MDIEDRGGTQETLVVELEDAAARSMWTSMLGLLLAGTQMWHFVGLVGGRPVYTSPTFAAPYSWGRLPLGKTMLPQEEWAPGMNQALEELRAAIREDGWIESGRGEHPWQVTYHRLAVAGSGAEASSR
ncbi:MAG: hypothetical protein ACTHKG_10455 [Nocardioides sp.]